MGLPPYGENKVVPVPSRHAQKNALAVSFSTLTEVAANRTFLILAGTSFVCGLSTRGLVQNHFVLLCSDFGIPSMTSSSILAMMGWLQAPQLLLGNRGVGRKLQGQSDRLGQHVPDATCRVRP